MALSRFKNATRFCPLPICATVLPQIKALTQFIQESEVCVRPGASPSISRAQIHLCNDKLVSEGL